MLEAFDLLADYGLQNGLLSAWYRAWLVPLLELQWKQGIAGVHQTHKAASSHEPSPVTILPDGYRIGVLTLWASTAGRAQ